MVNRKSPGRYRHRVTIYDPNPTLSDSGYPAENAQAISGGSSLPAWVYDVNSGEPQRDQQVEAHITTIVELRYLAGVKQKYHVLYGSRRLNIEKIQDVDGRGRYLMLQCTELGN